MLRGAFSFVFVSLLSLALEAAAPPAALAHAKRHAHIRPRSLPEATVSNLAAGSAKHVTSQQTGLSTMLEEIKALRGELAAQRQTGSWDEEFAAMEKQLEELEEMLRALQAKEAAHHSSMTLSHAELQAEIEKLRKAVERIEGKTHGASDPADVAGGTVDNSQAAAAEGGSAAAPGEDETGHSGSGADRTTEVASESSATADHATIEGGPVPESEAPEATRSEGGADGGAAAPTERAPTKEEVHGVGPYLGAGHHDGKDEKETTSVSAGKVAKAGAIDVDMQMPYGDLEPFGREDTAQELTEDSIRQSDQMVDQLERAEVAEEKRAVFRALTRLRGAAITSYDGIARSQTGNIDDYARKNQWRQEHPVHHLASEESDVAKWAFPDSTDF